MYLSPFIVRGDIGPHKLVTTFSVDLISGGWEDDRVNDGAKQVKQVK